MKNLDPEAVIRAAQQYLGCWYVWKGKGATLWTKGRGLVPHNFGGLVFDCSGLVTTAIKQAGGADLRATHAAQTLFDELQECPTPDARGVLRFYGKSPERVTHVSISLGINERGHLGVLEAAGGDETTTTIEAAKARHNARVRQGPDLRRDFLGARYLP